MTTREVEEACAEDEELLAVRQCINGKPWDQLVYKRYLLCSDELCSIGKLVLRGTRIVIPKKLRPQYYPLLTKAIWASFELSRSYAAKYGGLEWRKMLRSTLKHATDVSWSVVPVPRAHQDHTSTNRAVERFGC